MLRRRSRRRESPGTTTTKENAAEWHVRRSELLAAPGRGRGTGVRAARAVRSSFATRGGDGGGDGVSEGRDRPRDAWPVPQRRLDVPRRVRRHRRQVRAVGVVARSRTGAPGPEDRREKGLVSPLPRRRALDAPRRRAAPRRPPGQRLARLLEPPRRQGQSAGVRLLGAAVPVRRRRPRLRGRRPRLLRRRPVENSRGARGRLPRGLHLGPREPPRRLPRPQRPPLRVRSLVHLRGLPRLRRRLPGERILINFCLKKQNEGGGVYDDDRQHTRDDAAK
mmetsp:Transcript_9897/g.29983  ORF Transcript_9897/g.29983 Transcript_9897/m.29983 type:complete len:278 (-) Transcript_9897:2182-3015(-)